MSTTMSSEVHGHVMVMVVVVVVITEDRGRNDYSMEIPKITRNGYNPQEERES